MAKYRKKPVEIEAIKLGRDTLSEVCNFISKELFGGVVYLDDSDFKILSEGHKSNTIGVIIKTLEGEMLAKQGDYIIKGIKGEFYPCKPDIFEATYEKVESEVEEG